MENFDHDRLYYKYMVPSKCVGTSHAKISDFIDVCFCYMDFKNAKKQETKKNNTNQD